MEDLPSKIDKGEKLIASDRSRFLKPSSLTVRLNRIDLYIVRTPAHRMYPYGTINNLVRQDSLICVCEYLLVGCDHKRVHAEVVCLDINFQSAD